jgi:hypothetical protein
MSLRSLPICCETRRQLAEHLSTAARLFAEAVALFTGRSAMRSDNEYDRLRDAARAAQLRAEQSRVAFEEYVDSHRCGSETC